MTGGPVPTPAAPSERAGLRHLHPLTPFLRGWAVMGALIAGVGQQTMGDLGARTVLTALAGAVVVVLVYGWLAWRATWYGVVGGDLVHEQGILFRRSRRVRLDRLQSVDVVRPLVARLLGLAELRLEVAGGSGPEAPLAYLSEGDALRLRAELLARAAGIAETTPEAPERLLHRVPPVRLALSVLLSGATVAAVLGVLICVVAFVVTDEATLLLSLLTGVLGLLAVPVRRFVKHFEFTLAESPDGLRIRQGLTETRAQTVPPGRVQAIRVVRPFLWRLVGDWVSVQVTVAGYGGRTGDEAASMLLPVGPRPVVDELLQRILPGHDIGAVPLSGVPRRARLVDPLVWRRLAVGADGVVFVARRGLLQRELDVVPHAKPQSMRITQGPLQRRQRLATVHLDLTPGPVQVHAAHRDAAEAWTIVAAQAERSRRARSTAVRERWMTPSIGGAAGESGAP